MIVSRRSALKMLGAAVGTMPALQARAQEPFAIEIAKVRLKRKAPPSRPIPRRSGIAMPNSESGRIQDTQAN